MSIAVITAMHGRPQVTAVFLAGIRRIGLDCYASITDGDTENIELAKAHGIAYTTLPNDSVSDKFNAALSLARGHAAVMVLGSDDIVSEAWVSEAQSALSEGHQYLWPHRLAFYDPHKDRARVLQNDGGSVLRFGAGRVVGASILRKLDYQLWPAGLTRGLDQSSHSYVRGTGAMIWRSTATPIALTDIKTGGNLHPFERWPGMDIHPEEALWFMGDEEHILMEDLR